MAGIDSFDSIHQQALLRAGRSSRFSSMSSRHPNGCFVNGCFVEHNAAIGHHHYRMNFDERQTHPTLVHETMKKTMEEKYCKRWDEMYAKLVVFQRKYGHSNVPQQNGEFVGLGLWVALQRQRKRGTNGSPLTKEEEDRLDVLGFVWYSSPADGRWNCMFDRLQEYNRDYGNCSVPANYAKLPRLATWVEKQRKLQKKGELTSERRKRLESIGFSWTSNDVIPAQSQARPKKRMKRTTVSVDNSDYLERRAQEQWNESFDRLIKFKRTHGHWQVPTSWEEDTSLAAWVQSQRSNRNSLHLSQVKLLDIFGFPWICEGEEESQKDSEYETANEYDTADDSLQQSPVNPRQLAGTSERRYNIGTKVKKFFPEYGWFWGEVISFNGAASYTVSYSDGDREEHNDESLAAIALSPKLAVIDIDTEISLLWPSDKRYYKATIVRERDDEKDNYCVLYEDGSYEWVNLFERKFRLVGKGTRVESNGDEPVEIGSRVAFCWDDGMFYGVTVTDERDGIFTLEFDDGDNEKTDFVGCEYRILRKEKHRTRFMSP